MPASMTTAVADAAVGAERRTAISWQPDLFDGADPLVGIEVNLPHHCPCGNGALRIGPGRGPHRASLHCTWCGRHCGWVSNPTAKFLSDIIKHFGRPIEPVCVRPAKPSIVPDSAPPGADAV
jgi:hypothetical protein